MRKREPTPEEVAAYWLDWETRMQRGVSEQEKRRAEAVGARRMAAYRDGLVRYGWRLDENV